MLEFDHKLRKIEVSLNSYENVRAAYRWLRSQLYKDELAILVTPNQTIYLRGKWRQLTALQVLHEMMLMMDPTPPQSQEEDDA